jgi:hypothetical protein
MFLNTNSPNLIKQKYVIDIQRGSLPCVCQDSRVRTTRKTRGLTKELTERSVAAAGIPVCYDVAVQGNRVCAIVGFICTKQRNACPCEVCVKSSALEVTRRVAPLKFMVA